MVYYTKRNFMGYVFVIRAFLFGVFFFLNRKLEVMCIRTSQWDHIRLFSIKVVIQKGILIQLFYQDAYCFTVTHENSFNNRTSTMYTKLIDCRSVTFASSSETAFSWYFTSFLCPMIDRPTNMDQQTDQPINK